MTNFRPGDRVRYVGEITERECEATVEAHGIEGQQVILRLDNGAAIYADPDDIRERSVRPWSPVWPMEFAPGARISE